MANVIDELIISLGYRVDKKSTKELAEAAKAARGNAGEVQTAYEKASKKVADAQKDLAKATDKGSKEVAKSNLAAAKESERAWKDWAKEAETSAKSAERAFIASIKEEDRAHEKALKERTKAEEKANKKFIEGLEKRTGTGRKLFSAMSTGLVGVTAAATAAGAGIFAFVDSQTAALDKVAKQSDASGLGVEEYQRLAFVAERSGVSIDTVAKSSREVGKRLLEAQTKGTGPFTEGLAALGLEAEQFVGIPFEKRLGIIADALNGVEDESTRLALAQKLLGEETGPQLSNMLNLGSDGLREMGREAEKLGKVIDERGVRQAEGFQDALTDLKTSVSGAGQEIAVALVPQIQDAAGGITNWIQENRDFITQDLPGHLSRIGESVADLAILFGRLGKVLAPVVEGLLKLTETDDKKIEKNVRLTALRNQGFSMLRDQSETAAKELSAINEQYAREVLGDTDADFGAVSSLATIPTMSPSAASGGTSTAEINRRIKQAAEDAKGSKGKGRSAKERDAEKALTDAMEQVMLTGLDEEIRQMGERSGATDVAIDKAIEAAAKRFMDGAGQNVARKAAEGTLQGLTGVDLKRKTDPLLSAFMGDDALPDVPLSELERGQQPQVLISTINNTYDIAVTNNINGARDSGAVAGDVVDQFRRMFSDEVEATSKFSKVSFAR